MRLVRIGQRTINIDRVVQIVDNFPESTDQHSMTVVFESTDAVTPPHKEEFTGIDSSSLALWLRQNSVFITDGNISGGTTKWGNPTGKETKSPDGTVVNADPEIGQGITMARLVTIGARTLNMGQAVYIKGPDPMPLSTGMPETLVDFTIIFSAVGNPSPWLTVNLTGKEATWFDAWLADRSNIVFLPHLYPKKDYTRVG